MNDTAKTARELTVLGLPVRIVFAQQENPAATAAVQDILKRVYLQRSAAAI